MPTWGDMHSFYAQVSGGIGTLQYQWMWNGTPETGATAPLYQFGPLTTAHTGSYTCRIEDESEVVVTTEPRRTYGMRSHQYFATTRRWLILPRRQPHLLHYSTGRRRNISLRLA